MAWDQSLNTQHIASNLNAYESGRSGFFVFYIPAKEFENDSEAGPDRQLYQVDFNRDGGDATNDDIWGSNYVSDALRLNVVKANVPNFEVTTHEYRRGNDTVKFAGVPTYTSGSLIVDDLVGLNTKEILYAWFYKVYDPITRKGGRMAEYKKTAYLIEYTQDHQQIRYWTLEGCFITNIAEDEFNKESDDKRQLNISFSFDRSILTSSSKLLIEE